MATIRITVVEDRGTLEEAYPHFKRSNNPYAPHQRVMRVSKESIKAIEIMAPNKIVNIEKRFPAVIVDSESPVPKGEIELVRRCPQF